MEIDILTIGDASIDEFLQVEEAKVQCDINKKDCVISFDYGDKIPVEHFKTVVAGNAINVGIGTKKLGLKTAVYSELGDDNNANLIIEKLRSLDIKTDYLVKNKNKNTNVHPIIVYKGERTIFSYHEKQEYKLGNWNKPKIVYYTSLSEGFESFQKDLLKYLNSNKDIIFAMNPGSTMLRTNINALRKTFKRLDILFVNEEEAEELTNYGGSIDKLHKKLSEMGVKMSVITNNTQGSSVYDGEEIYKLGICDLGKLVDATGAGDSYASGFISAIFHNRPTLTAMKWGTINAGSVITRIGAIEGLKTLEEMEKLILQSKFTATK